MQPHRAVFPYRQFPRGRPGPNIVRSAPYLTAATQPVYISRDFQRSNGRERGLGTFDTGVALRGGSAGHSRLAYARKRGEQRATLAQSRKYRKHSFSARRGFFWSACNISHGRGRFRPRRRNTDAYLRGDDHRLLASDVRSSRPLAESSANHGPGSKVRSKR